MNEISRFDAPCNSVYVPPTVLPPRSKRCGTRYDGALAKFKFNMQTDGNGGDINWKLQVKNKGEFKDYYISSKTYGDNKLVKERYCIPDYSW